MVRSGVLIAACVTLFISLILPVVLYIVYGVKNKGKGVWTAWLLGAAGFFVFQVIIRMPILSILSLNQGFLDFASNYYVLYCLILAFTAGLFEVIGRYIVAKILSKNISYEKGFAAGLGHGGIEAMFIVGMTYINNLLYIAMINTGSFDMIVEQAAELGTDTSSLITIKDTLINSSPYVFYLAGYERILTMVFHVALSLIVFYFVWKKKDVIGIIICLILHTLVDFVAPILSGLASDYLGNVITVNTSYVIIYGFLTVVAVLSIIVIRYIKKSWSNIAYNIN